MAAAVATRRVSRLQRHFSAAGSPKVALITCATRFMGPMSTKALIADGFSVFCHDRSFGGDDPSAATARANFEAEHPGAKALSAQVPAEIVSELLRTSGGMAPDVLINNDDHEGDGLPIEQADITDFRDTLEDLVVFPYHLVRMAHT